MADMSWSNKDLRINNEIKEAKSEKTEKYFSREEQELVETMKTTP